MGIVERGPVQRPAGRVPSATIPHPQIGAGDRPAALIGAGSKRNAARSGRQVCHPRWMARWFCRYGNRALRPVRAEPETRTNDPPGVSRIPDETGISLRERCRTVRGLIIHHLRSVAAASRSPIPRLAAKLPP